MTYHKKDVLTISPSQCAEGLLNDLGHEQVTNGHISHKIQGFIYHLVPEFVFNRIWMKWIAPEYMEERRKAEIALRRR
jgi:hypothetical protein